MAGIGFELKGLFRKKGIFALFRAYGYTGIVTTGPMILGIALLLGIMFLADFFGVGKHGQDLLVSMVTYALLASLIVTSFFSMVVTRYIADMFYEERKDAVMPASFSAGWDSLWGVSAVFGSTGPLSGAGLFPVL